MDFIVIGGSEAKNDHRYKIDNNTTIIKAHAFDYDRYLEEEDKNNKTHIIPDEPFALFIDSDIVYHPDFIYSDIEPYVSGKTYYRQLNKFFDEFEKRNMLKIIIASHPRSEFSKDNNPYNGREIIRGTTITLVKNSSIVLSHASRAITFSVLYYKPTILIDSNDYAHKLRAHIKSFSNSLQLVVINISDNCNIDIDKIKVNNFKYDDYRLKYIKEPGTPNKFISDIFCDYLDNFK
jgi:hypothetical protein